MPIDTARRSARVDPDAATADAFVLAERHDAGEGAWHTHTRAQLIHARVGVITVTTGDGAWVVPPERAVWVLPDVPHAVASRRGYDLLTLYVRASATPLPRASRVVAVDALAAALLAEAATFGPAWSADTKEERLVRVLCDRLPALDALPFHLPLPTDARVAPIARGLRERPDDDRTLAAWSRDAGVSERTAARVFEKETGLSFGAFRTQARMVRALELLGEGASVTATAIDVGYRDVSAFISAFQAAFGTTPGKYAGKAGPAKKVSPRRT